MVKPGGTGSPRLAISARFAPLPPSRSRICAPPSALASPVASVHGGFCPAFQPSCGESAEGLATFSACRSTQKPQADEPDDDQINRHDDVQKPRNDEDEDAGDKGDDRLQMLDAEGHGISTDEIRVNKRGTAARFPLTIMEYEGHS